ncbi:MAG: hypothetical protein A4E45_00874 [Methanosaeta sp. PtaB.Bin039]|nr:MAG: hypothetical protein A4E45_00874 [Methanosaeta sp. PtaB.Bin039]
MLLKTHRSGAEVLVAVCDCELVGCSFEEENLFLEVSPGFFGEEKACFKDVEKALHRATMANFVGEKAVACAISLCYVEAENVLRIGGIPTAQMVRM